MNANRARKGKHYKKRAYEETSSGERTTFSKNSEKHSQFDEEKHEHAERAIAIYMWAQRWKKKKNRKGQSCDNHSFFLANESNSEDYGWRFNVARASIVREVPFHEP